MCDVNGPCIFSSYFIITFLLRFIVHFHHVLHRTCQALHISFFYHRTFTLPIDSRAAHHTDISEH